MLKLFKKYIEEKNKDNENRDEKLKTAVSALLLEAAYYDDEFSEEEKIRIIKLIKNRFSLNDTEAEELIEIADRARNNSVDLWHFTDLINKNYSDDEKTVLMEMLWETVYADDVLDRHEDYLMHILSRLLKMDPKAMIAAKLKAKS